MNNAISSYELNLWQQRVNTDNDFIRFRQLQLTISPATLYSGDATMKDRATIMYLSKLWVMKPTTVRQCHICGSVKQDILKHLIGECPLTRQELDHFFHFIRIHFGNAVANELASVSANDLLVKLLGMKFACDFNMDDMACLRVESFKLLKHLTVGLSLY